MVICKECGQVKGNYFYLPHISEREPYDKSSVQFHVELKRVLVCQICFARFPDSEEAGLHAKWHLSKGDKSTVSVKS